MMARRNLIWPSPVAVEAKLNLPPVNRSCSLSNSCDVSSTEAAVNLARELIRCRCRSHLAMQVLLNEKAILSLAHLGEERPLN